MRRWLVPILVLGLACVAAAPPLDDYAYDHARRCVSKPTPGAQALVRWLKRNSRGQF